MSDEGSPTQNPPETQESRTVDGMEELLDQTEQKLADADAEKSAATPTSLQLNELGDEAVDSSPASIDLLNDVDLDLRIELGRTHMRLEDVLQLRSGSVVALDRLAGDPVDIFVNDRLVAKGEVLVLNENFCVRVTDLVSGGIG